ncbi:MAG: energy transducer TonB [Bacteroidia bacterium]
MRPDTLNIHQFIREKEKQEKRKLALLISEVLVWICMGGLIFFRISTHKEKVLPLSEPYYAYTFFYPEDSDSPKPIGLDSLREILDTIVAPANSEPQTELMAGLSDILEEKFENKEKLKEKATEKTSEKKKKNKKPTLQKVSFTQPEQARMSLFSNQLPTFPGGNIALNQYLHTELKYPNRAVTESIEGKVLLRLWVEADGKITDATIVEGLGYGCDEEAIRLALQMPAWNPGERQGRKTAMAAYIPVVFSR